MRADVTLAFIIVRWSLKTRNKLVELWSLPIDHKFYVFL